MGGIYLTLMCPTSQAGDLLHNPSSMCLQLQETVTVVLTSWKEKKKKV